MVWIIASLPLWFLGVLSLSMGVYGLFAVGYHEGNSHRFENCTDGQALFLGVGFICASSLIFVIAAKICS